MHVSYVYDAPVPSRRAAWIQILSTCRALAARGPAVTVYAGALRAENAEAALRFYGLDPHPNLRIVPLFGDGSWPKRLAAHRRLRAALRRATGERHVLVSRDGVGLRLHKRLRWMRLGQRPVPPYVHEAHHVCFAHYREQLLGQDPSALGRLWARYRVARVRMLERAVVTGADGLLCLTEGVRAALGEAFSPTGPTVVLPSATAVPPAEPPGDEARDIDVLYAGKLQRRKGVYDLVDAMRFLPGRRLWVVGGMEARSVDALARHAEAAGVRERIVFTGFVEPANVRAFYRRARVGVCPLPVGESLIAERFTSPLKILDMMACGTPIAATDLPPVRALLAHRETALLAEPSNPEALAGAIRMLLEDRALAGRLARAARGAVRAHSWESRAERLHAFLLSVA